MTVKQKRERERGFLTKAKISKKIICGTFDGKVKAYSLASHHIRHW
jgi:hypothetical protein